MAEHGVVEDRGQRFWSQFGHQDRSAVTQFANRLQESDADVVMFTARKSACLGDCLRLVQAWTPHSVICSDRALSFDTTWLAGKRVLVVDDVIGTGMTADHLLGRLELLPVNALSFLPLASRPEWPSAIDALRIRHPNATVLEPPLATQATAGLSEEIVRAIAAVPRPYNLDWPLLAGWQCTKSEFDTLIANCGWNARQLSSPAQVRTGVEVITLEPRSRVLPALVPWLVAPESTVALAKIRLYAEPIGDETYALSVMPIFAFDRLALNDLPRLLRSTGVLLPEPGATIAEGSTRLAQYIASLALGRDFERQAQRTSTLGDLGESQWQRQLSFGPNYAAHHLDISRETVRAATEAERPTFLRQTSRTPKQAADAAAEAHFARSRLSAFLWSESRQGDGRLARTKAAGGDVQEMVRFLDQPAGQPGFRASDLTAVLTKDGLGESAAALASGFLDEAIDNGLTVPVLRETEYGLERVFRAGESIEFSMREQRLFFVLIEEFLRRAPSLRVGHILLEKMLVLAVRFGAQRPQLLKEAFLPSSSSILTVAYSRYGSIASPDPSMLDLPIATVETHTLGKELSELGVIEWLASPPGEPPGVRVALGKVELEEVSPADEAPFRRIGALLADILAIGAIGRAEFELFVVLCNGEQIPLALGAEINRVLIGLKKLANRLGPNPASAVALRTLLNAQPDADNDWYLSLESGLQKLKGLADGIVSSVDSRLRSSLRDDPLLNWQELAGSVCVPMTASTHLLVDELTEWLLKTKICVERLKELYGASKEGRRRTNVDVDSVARSLGLEGKTDAFKREISGRGVEETAAWRDSVLELVRAGSDLGDEVAVAYDTTARRGSPERYDQALLVVSPSRMTQDARDAVNRAVTLLLPRQRLFAHVLPTVVVGDSVAGFAVKENVLDVAEQLFPYFDESKELAACTVVVIQRLGPTSRLLRRQLNSYWYGGGFQSLCLKLPNTPSVMAHRLVIVEALP